MLTIRFSFKAFKARLIVSWLQNSIFARFLCEIVTSPPKASRVPSKAIWNGGNSRLVKIQAGIWTQVAAGSL
mgnify:CR=1 FL=1